MFHPSTVKVPKEMGLKKISDAYDVCSFCQIDRDRELNNPPDKPFKASPCTYINRTCRRLFAIEDRALEEYRAAKELLENCWQELAAQEVRISLLEQAQAAPSKPTAAFFWRK